MSEAIETPAVGSMRLLDALVARKDYWENEAKENGKDSANRTADLCASRALGIAEAIKIITSASNNGLDG